MIFPSALVCISRPKLWNSSSEKVSELLQTAIERNNAYLEVAWISEFKIETFSTRLLLWYSYIFLSAHAQISVKHSSLDITYNVFATKVPIKMCIVKFISIHIAVHYMENIIHIAVHC